MPPCDVCSRRNKTSTCVSRCESCDLSFCYDCDFTHSQIPASSRHQVTRVASLGEGSSVDLQDFDSSLSVDGEGDEVEGCGPQFIPQREFNVAGENDECPPELRDVVVLESGIILTTDWANCTLKVFDKEGKFLADHFFQPSGKDAGRPHGITVKTGNSVCVTLPSLRKIATMTVSTTKRGVTLTAVLHSTKRRYFGIAYLAEMKQLVAGTTDTVDILTGTSCKPIQTLQGQGQSFANPYNMGIESTNSVLVSDTKSNRLYRIDGDQNITTILCDESFMQLRGVTCDPHKNIFFCGIKYNGIGWISDEGEHMGALLSGSFKEAVGIHVQTTPHGQIAAIAQKDGKINVCILK